VDGADLAAAFDEREDRLFVAGAALYLRAGLATDVGLVRLDNATTAAHERLGAEIGHRHADTVGQEPSRLIGHSQHAVELVRGDALFGGAEQIGRRQPLGQRNLGSLEDGAHGHGELLAALLLAALPQALAVRLALKLVVVADRAAVRADRTIRPAHRL